MLKSVFTVGLTFPFEVASASPKLIGTHTLNFKLIFECSLNHC